MQSQFHNTSDQIQAACDENMDVTHFKSQIPHKSSSSSNGFNHIDVFVPRSSFLPDLNVSGEGIVVINRGLTYYMFSMLCL